MLSHPNESGGERRLEDQLGMEMSNHNYLLMKAKAKQFSAQRLLQLREDKKPRQIQAVNLDDDGIFSDDEGGYSQTSFDIHQGFGDSLGSLLRFRRQWQYQGIVRAIRSLNSRPAAIQMSIDQSCTTNGRPLMNQLPVANERPQVNQTPVATWVSQTPVATMVSQTPVATMVAANGKPLMSQIPAPNGRPVVGQRPAANGRSQMNQIHVTIGELHTNKIPGPEVHPAPMACPAKVADLKLKVEEGKMKALHQKLTGSRSRLTPKQEEVPTTKVTRTVATKKQEPRCGLLQRGTRLLKKWRLRSTQRAAGI